MATRAAEPWYHPLTAEEFVEMDFGDAKAELVNGAIYMMAGGSYAHAAVQANLIMALGFRLRGTGCRPLTSDMATKTGEFGVRYPDVSVYCGNVSPDDARKRLVGNPRVVFEVLSPSTSSNDQIAKLAEYRALPGVAAIVLSTRIGSESACSNGVARKAGPTAGFRMEKSWL